MNVNFSDLAYGNLGIWWNTQSWMMGPDEYTGLSIGFAYFRKDVFCPSQIQDIQDWAMLTPGGFVSANEHLLISCKYYCNSNRGRSQTT